MLTARGRRRCMDDLNLWRATRDELQNTYVIAIAV